MAVAKTQKTINDASSAVGRSAGVQSAFERIEDKADCMLDETTAMAELNTEPIDEAKALEKKYARLGSTSMDGELAEMKGELGCNTTGYFRRS